MMQPMLSADISDYDPSDNDDYSNDKMRKGNNGNTQRQQQQQQTSSELYYQIRRIMEYMTRRLGQISDTVQQSVKNDKNGFCPILLKHIPKINTSSSYYPNTNSDSWKVNVTIRCKANTNQTSPTLLLILILVLCSVCFISIVRVQTAMEYEYHVTNQFVQEQIVENEINRLYNQYIKQKERKEKERKMLANVEAYEQAAAKAKKDAERQKEHEEHEKERQDKKHNNNDKKKKNHNKHNRGHKVKKTDEQLDSSTNLIVTDENHHDDREMGRDHENNIDKDDSTEQDSMQQITTTMRKTNMVDITNNNIQMLGGTNPDQEYNSDNEDGTTTTATNNDEEPIPHMKLDTDLLLDVVPKAKKEIKFRKRDDIASDGNNLESSSSQLNDDTTKEGDDEKDIPNVALDTQLFLDVSQRAKKNDIRQRDEEVVTTVRKRKTTQTKDNDNTDDQRVVSKTRKRLKKDSTNPDNVASDKGKSLLSKIIKKATKTTTTIVPSSLSSVDATILHGGAGQRLLKLVDANYLSNQLNYGLRTYWGYCPSQSSINGAGTSQNETEIFHHLFGHQPVDMNEKINKARRTGIALEYNTHANLNDIEIIPGFQKLIREPPQDPIGAFAKNKKCPSNCNVEKATTDMKFYNDLRTRFRYHNEVDTFRGKFFTPDNGKQQVTIGLHIRAGNGEKGDFVRQNRTIDNEEMWLDNMVTRILDVKKQQSPGTKIVLFVVTDTKSMFAKVEEALHKRQVTAIQVITYNNPVYTHPPEGTAVGTTGADTCLKEWEHAYIDMMLLSYVDVLIAARPSGFTQSLPMSSLFEANVNSHHSSIIKKYCEVTKDATEMKCYTTFQQWCCDGATSYTGIQKYDYVRVPSNPINLIPSVTDTRNSKFSIQPRDKTCTKPLPAAASSSPSNKLNESKESKNSCLPYEWSPPNTGNQEIVAQIK